MLRVLSVCDTLTAVLIGCYKGGNFGRFSQNQVILPLIVISGCGVV